MEEKQQVKPLTPTSFVGRTISSEEESITKWLSSSSPDLRKWRCIVRCCGCCSAGFAIIGLITLVLAFTIFKVKNPILTLNSIYIKHFNINLSPPNHPISINATLTADISIKNPNAASFRFNSSTTEFFYMGETVGVAYAPGTKVSAGRTVRMNVTVHVLAYRMATQTNVTGRVALGGVVNLTTYTGVSGRVTVIGLYKSDVDVRMNCSMSLDLSPSDHKIKNKVCQANVIRF